MSKIIRNLALILLLSSVFSSPSLLLVIEVQAQNNIGPTISILSPSNGTVFEVGPRQMVDIQLNYQTNDTISWVGYSLGGAKNVTIIGNTTLYDFEGSGHYNLTLYANDTAGNWANPQTVTWQTKIQGDIGPPYLPYILLLIAVTLIVVIIVVVIPILVFRRHRKKSIKPNSPIKTVFSPLRSLEPTRNLSF